MKIKALIFDTETTGSPKKYIAAEEDLNNYPQVVQLAASLIEIDLEDLTTVKVIYSFNSLITPFRKGNPIEITAKAESVHGKSFALCEKEGQDLNTVLFLFQGIVNNADLIIAHNLFFDKNVMISEYLNNGMRLTHKRSTKQLCTMRYVTPILKLPGKFKNQHKYPSLAELFTYCTDSKIEDYYKAHDAEQDVSATIICLLSLIKEDNNLQKWLKGEIENIY